jgi:hypothetical protein
LSQTTNVHVFAGKEASPAKVGLLTMFSQGAAGGATAAFAFMLVIGLLLGEGADFPLVVFFAAYLLFGALVGLIISLFLWIAGKILRRRLGIMLRILLAISFLSLVPILPSLIDVSGAEWSLFLGSFFFGSIFGVPVGILVGSNIRPFRTITYGFTPRRTTAKVLFHSGPIRISRLGEVSKFSLLAGLPLRATSFLALMVSLLGLPFFLRDWERSANFEDEIGAVIATVYFGLTVCVSFATRSKLIALAMTVGVNALLGAWILHLKLPSMDTDILRATAIAFICFWLLFVGGLLFDKPQGGDLRVEYDPREIRFSQRQLAKAFK